MDGFDTRWMPRSFSCGRVYTYEICRLGEEYTDVEYVDYDVKSVDYDEIMMRVYTGEVCRLWVGVSGCGYVGGRGGEVRGVDLLPPLTVYMCEYMCM